MIPAPIAIFVYRRPGHLRETLRNVLRCDGLAGTRIVVFGDGPRSSAQAAEVHAAREVARELLGRRAEYRFSEFNRGLSASITTGVSELLAVHDRVIVLEDDLRVGAGFFSFMNSALERYRDEPAVMHVSGHMFDVPALAEREEALFLPYTSSWGWATWRRAWSHYDSHATGWEQLRTDRELRRRFNLGGAFDYVGMLERQMKGVGDSWAIRWYWSVFRAGGLGVYPPVTLVANTGLDGSGTHGRGWLRRVGSRRGPSDRNYSLPECIEIDARLCRQVCQEIRRQNGGWLGAAIDRARRVRLDLGL